MLRQFKRATLTGLKSAGVFDLCRRSRWRQNRLLILCYHGISLGDEHHWNPGLYMSGPDFEARLQLLADEHYHVLPLNEALIRLERKSLPPASVAITVDDGHYDFYKQAFPRIRKFGFPVTVYLSSFYTLYNRPIFDGFCSYLLWKARGLIMPACQEIGLREPFDLGNEGSRFGAWRAIKEFTTEKRMKADEKDGVLQRLAGHLGLSYMDLAARRILHNLNPAEVSQLAKEGVNFELHTHRHRTPVDYNLFTREIRDNRKCILEMTDVNPTHFCYPSGVYRQEFLPWLSEERVTSATTCNTGLNGSRSNPLLLARLLDHSMLRPIEFEAWLNGCNVRRRRSPNARRTN
jgi:peptidoglycan/xylan/chitin deacetylase (PgdA/CDA1 family)